MGGKKRKVAAHILAARSGAKLAGEEEAAAAGGPPTGALPKQGAGEGKGPTSKKKRKRSVPAEEDSKVPLVDQARQYLSEWKRHIKGKPPKGGASWKFNKRIQTWILANLWDTDIVDEDLFKSSKRYLQTIQGGARDRIKNEAEARCLQGSMQKMNSGGDDDNNSDDLEDLEQEIQRARMVKSLLGVGIENDSGAEE
jgi:hypothetical protein